MKTLIYVGANRGFGLYRLLQKRQFDVIYAFEPDPEMFEQLKTNYSNVPQITCINAACSKETGPKTLYITENRVSSSLSDVNMSNQEQFGGHSGGKPAFKTTEIHSVNLKEFCTINNIKHIDFLKCDCEGGEYDVFQPSNIEFLKTIPKIVTEFHLRDDENFHKCKFRWFRDKRGLVSWISFRIDLKKKYLWYITDVKNIATRDGDYIFDILIESYEEAELACLKKLIEIANEQR